MCYARRLSIYQLQSISQLQTFAWWTLGLSYFHTYNYRLEVRLGGSRGAEGRWWAIILSNGHRPCALWHCHTVLKMEPGSHGVGPLIRIYPGIPGERTSTTVLVVEAKKTTLKCTSRHEYFERGKLLGELEVNEPKRIRTKNQY